MRSWPPFPDIAHHQLGYWTAPGSDGLDGHDNERAAMICQHALRDVARRAGLAEPTADAGPAAPP